MAHFKAHYAVGFAERLEMKVGAVPAQKAHLSDLLVVIVLSGVCWQLPCVCGSKKTSNIGSNGVKMSL